MFDLFEFYFFCLGLVFGSFGNVIIWRLPRNESIIRPRSHCPKCNHSLKWYELVPIVSWTILRFRCRACGTPIPWRYPLVELITGILFLLVYQRYGLSWESLELFIFFFSLVVVSFIDLDHMILPDAFTLSGVLIGFAGSFLPGGRAWWESLLGIFFGGGVLWLIGFLYTIYRKEEGMGGGDVKLLAWIGAVLGWQSLPFVILIASVLGSLVGLAVALRAGSRGLRTAIPFGPYLALGAVFYALGGDEWGHMYLRLFLPGLVD